MGVDCHRRLSGLMSPPPPLPGVCRGHDGQVKQGEQEGLHARDSVGQTSGATQRCLKPGCSQRIGNSRRSGGTANFCASSWPAAEGVIAEVGKLVYLRSAVEWNVTFPGRGRRHR